MSEWTNPAERHPRLTDDDRLRQAITEYNEAGQRGVIPDTIARIIASRWHGGQASALYSFTSTGRIDLEGLQGELLQEFIRPDLDDQDREELDVLALYLLETGDRDVVEGWHQATRWGQD